MNHNFLYSSPGLYMELFYPVGQMHLKEIKLFFSINIQAYFFKELAVHFIAKKSKG